jgi:hypothetical protein
MEEGVHDMCSVLGVCVHGACRMGRLGVAVYGYMKHLALSALLPGSAGVNMERGAICTAVFEGVGWGTFPGIVHVVCRAVVGRWWPSIWRSPPPLVWQ